MFISTYAFHFFNSFFLPLEPNFSFWVTGGKPPETSPEKLLRTQTDCSEKAAKPLTFFLLYIVAI